MIFDRIKKTFELLRANMPLIGETILEVYNDPEQASVQLKKDESPVTKADKLANEIIVKLLAESTPDIPIISEENKEISYDERKNWKYCWMVDPLDGTKEFINKNGEFTVNIAFIQDSEVIAGMVYVPVTKAHYEAIKGFGAWQINVASMSQLKCQSFDESAEGVRAVCSRSHLNEDTNFFLSRFESPQLVPKGSSLKFISIACNEADIYPRLGPTMEWDTAAAHIILEEAGGSVRQPDGTKLSYNKENLLNPHFIASANKSN